MRMVHLIAADVGNYCDEGQCVSGERFGEGGASADACPGKSDGQIILSLFRVSQKPVGKPNADSRGPGQYWSQKEMKHCSVSKHSGAMGVGIYSFLTAVAYAA